MTSKDYIIVTPCKNEEKNLPKLASSIVNQTLKPSLWLIFDDNSTDSSSQILEELTKKYAWIRVVKGVFSKRDLGFHYASIVSNAIKYTYKISKKEDIYFEYIGLIDADMILELDFFEKILERFEENPKLGIASGSVAYVNGGKKMVELGRHNHPIGGLRVWSKKCFEDTGGFPISYSADSVSNVSAILKGWDTEKYDDIIGIQTRETSSAEGLWNGYKTRGKSDYYRGYHPIYVLFKYIKYSSTYPFYIGLPYIYEYIKSVFQRKEKIDLIHIRNYYHNKHYEIIKYYIDKIKQK